VAVVEDTNRFVGKRVDGDLEGALDFGGALRLQKHVIERKRVGDTAAIELGTGLSTRVAIEPRELGVVDGLGDEGSRPWCAARTDEPRLATRPTSRAAAANAAVLLDILFTFARIFAVGTGDRKRLRAEILSEFCRMEG